MNTKKESQLSKNNNGEIILNGTRVRYVPQAGILGIVVSGRKIFDCREKARFSSEYPRNHEIWFRYEYEVIVIRRKYRKSEKFVVRKPVVKLVAYYINPDEVIPSGAVVWVEPSPQLDCFMIINWGEEVEFCPPASSGSSSSSSDQGGEGSKDGVRIDVPIRICVENLASSGQPGGGSGGGGNIRTKTEYLPVYLPRGSILDWDNRYCVINEQDCCEFDYGRNSSGSNCDTVNYVNACNASQYVRFNMEDGSGNTIGCKAEWRILDFTVTSGDPGIRPDKTRGYIYADPNSLCVPSDKCKWVGCIDILFPEFINPICFQLAFNTEAKSGVYTHTCYDGILIGRMGNVYRYILSGSYVYAGGTVLYFSMVYEIALI
jgi:hypothetical protein